jgi:hypothetical protein
MNGFDPVGTENLIHRPDLAVPDVLANATTWEIATNSVGNALSQAAVPPAQVGFVATPLTSMRSTGRSASPISSAGLATGQVARLGGGHHRHWGPFGNCR